MSCLYLQLLFCCGCMLSSIFTFTWHPPKEGIPGEQVPRGFLSCDCELWEVIPIYFERQVVLVDGSSMKIPGEIKFRLFRWWQWLKIFLRNCRGRALRFRYCWWHCKHFIFIIAIVCINFTFRAVTCDVFLFFYFTFFGNPKKLIFERLFLFQSGLLFFCLRTILLMGWLFSFCSTLCLLCWPPWFDFYTKHQRSINNSINNSIHLEIYF